MKDMPMLYSDRLTHEVETEDWEFYAEALQAWRAWKVELWDEVLILRSITYKTRWIPKQELIAECRPLNETRIPKFPHLCPNLDHMCGIYSVKTLDDAHLWKKFPQNSVTAVYGQVSIWGNVFKFTRGYLSEFAYPSRLIVPELGNDFKEDVSQEEIAMILSDTYGVPAEVE